jgi:hypothetical protein
VRCTCPLSGLGTLIFTDENRASLCSCGSASIHLPENKFVAAGGLLPGRRPRGRTSGCYSHGLHRAELYSNSQTFDLAAAHNEHWQDITEDGHGGARVISALDWATGSKSIASMPLSYLRISTFNDVVCLTQSGHGAVHLQQNSPTAHRKLCHCGCSIQASYADCMLVAVSNCGNVVVPE